ncbi:MAG: hypothetical protein IT330_00320 [Anaerolineae bacterium]|nr:hypothetical protein [Anaerolineae bacterium]
MNAESDIGTTTRPTLPAPVIRRAILQVAWLSILLGLVLEAVVVVAVVGFRSVQTVAPLVPDLTQKITWSLIVCVGIAAGKWLSRSHAPSTGLAGLIAAPLGFHVARALQKAVTVALQLSLGSVLASPILLSVSLLKGLEYGCLGAILAWLGKQPGRGLAAHVTAGAVVAATFGSAILYLMAWGRAQPAVTLAFISSHVNEYLFPIGCSIVVFASDRLGRLAQQARARWSSAKRTASR